MGANTASKKKMSQAFEMLKNSNNARWGDLINVLSKAEVGDDKYVDISDFFGCIEAYASVLNSGMIRLDIETNNPEPSCVLNIPIEVLPTFLDYAWQGLDGGQRVEYYIFGDDYYVMYNLDKEDFIIYNYNTYEFLNPETVLFYNSSFGGSRLLWAADELGFETLHDNQFIEQVEELCTGANWTTWNSVLLITDKELHTERGKIKLSDITGNGTIVYNDSFRFFVVLQKNIKRTIINKPRVVTDQQTY